MTENKQLTGLKIVCTPNLPLDTVNEETNELETVHMIRYGDTLFVSEELGNALNERWGDDE